jgi:hypothetical protein
MGTVSAVSTRPWAWKSTARRPGLRRCYHRIDEEPQTIGRVLGVAVLTDGLQE